MKMEEAFDEFFFFKLPFVGGTLCAYDYYIKDYWIIKSAYLFGIVNIPRV